MNEKEQKYYFSIPNNATKTLLVCQLTYSDHFVHGTDFLTPPSHTQNKM